VVDITSAISTFMSVKDNKELACCSINQHLFGSNIHAGIKRKWQKLLLA